MHYYRLHQENRSRFQSRRPAMDVWNAHVASATIVARTKMTLPKYHAEGCQAAGTIAIRSATKIPTASVSRPNRKTTTATMMYTIRFANAETMGRLLPNAAINVKISTNAVAANHSFRSNTLNRK